MSESWDDYAEDWDTNKDVIAYSKKAFSSLNTEQSIEGLKIMDFGCGTGLLTEQMSPLAKSIFAVDTSEKMVSVLIKKALKNVTAKSLDLINHPDEMGDGEITNFDLVTASSVCAFVEEYEKTVEILKSFLRPGGKFIQWDWMKSPQEPNFGFDVEDINRVYGKIGFSKIDVKEAFSLESEKGTMKVVMGIGTK